MKPCSIVVGIVLIAFCSGCVYFDKKYFENVTGIKMPATYHIIESYDNAEYLTGVTLELDSVELADFIAKNCLDPAKNNWYYQPLIGKEILGSQRPADKPDGNTFFLYGEKSKNIQWRFVADTKRNLLWIQVKYPDWAGN